MMEAMDEKIVAITGKLDPYKTRNLDIDRAIFKAGYEQCASELEENYLLKWKRAGIREVVEWLRKYPRILDELRDVLPKQLKEWGL